MNALGGARKNGPRDRFFGKRYLHVHKFRQLKCITISIDEIEWTENTKILS